MNYFFISKRNTGKSLIIKDILKSRYKPPYFICDIENLTLGRVYSNFRIINLYDDKFKDATVIQNFYDDSFIF